MITNSQLKPLALALALALAATASHAAINGTDDFNDNSRDTAKWEPDFGYNTGAFNETNQRLEYSVSSPTEDDDDFAYRLWKLNQATYDTDWEVRLEVVNTVVPGLDQETTVGIEVFLGLDFANSTFIELYASGADQLPFRRGFASDLYGDDVRVGLGDTFGSVSPTVGAIRLVFNSHTKVITTYYDANGSTGGFTWTRLASYGIAGSGGLDANADWGMSGADTFNVALYGYSFNMPVSGTQAYADNFVALTGPGSAPPLSQTFDAGMIHLAWPESAVGYELEQRASLTGANWGPSAQTPALSGSTYQISFPATGTEGYFRLAKP